MRKGGAFRGENWKRGLRISRCLFEPLLFYVLIHDGVLLCMERWKMIEIPADIAAAAVSSLVFGTWYGTLKRNSAWVSLETGSRSTKVWSDNKKFLSEKLRVSWERWGTGKRFGAYLLLVPAAAITSVVLNQLLRMSGISYVGYNEVKGQVYQLALIWQIAGSGILIPLAEELVFRGLGFRNLRRELDWLPAAVFTSVLFALYHGNWIQGIYAFLMGLLLALVYEAYGNLTAPWLFHASANLTAILLTSISAFGGIV